MSFPYYLLREREADNISYVNPRRAPGFLVSILGARKANPVQVLANNLELILLAAFLLTGLVGGFLAQARRSA